MLAPHYTDDLMEAGCDEAGRGCLAGPVVAAAVILPKHYQHAVLNDSKKLTKTQREAIRQDILRDALAYNVAEVDNKEIDKINILQASFKAMHLAIKGLHTTPQFLLIDGNRFLKYDNIPHACIVKGDGKYSSIAAASILAKTHRDDLMEQYARQYPGYGWERNKGYGTKEHKKGLEKLGPTLLHRESFAPVRGQLKLF